MAEADRPAAFCTILAGPNGSGKSTIYPLLAPVGEFVNADVAARRLAPANPESASMAAGRLILKTLDDALSQRRSFVYETTLSSRQSLSVMERCKALGYEVALVYVALDSPELNVLRVAERVSRGGHDIPANVIRRRFETAFGRLPHALRIADSSLLFDNSGLVPELTLALDRREIVANRLDRANPLHVRLGTAVGHALDIGIDAVFAATPATR